MGNALEVRRPAPKLGGAIRPADHRFYQKWIQAHHDAVGTPGLLAGVAPD
ncbi:MAG: hypothetical protein P4L85_29430 [Paludisphaera borealis]|nr:hypothetical protein [Paludisphaera borealis]MDR3623491.1 hypothetical protein [Paludisphaera borealis]